MKKRLTIFLLIMLALFCTLGACSAPKEKDSSISFEQSTAYFTSSDVKKLRPILKGIPKDSECVSKTITLNIENLDKINLSFDFVNNAPQGLKCSFDNGVTKEFKKGNIFEKKVDNNEKQVSVVVKVWLSVEAPKTLAETDFAFSIKAVGTRNKTTKETLNENNKVFFDTIKTYEWTQNALNRFSNGIEFVVREENVEPLDLTVVFDEPTITATFTADGEEPINANVSKFSCEKSGKLTITSHALWYTEDTKEVSVTYKEEFDEENIKAYFTVKYPTWYTESDDKLIATPTNIDTKQTITRRVRFDATENKYYIMLPKGNFNIEIGSTRFKKDLTSDKYLIQNFVIGDTDIANNSKVIEETALSFSIINVGNTLGLTFNETGVKIASGNNQFRPLNGVVAKEGFVISYSMYTKPADNKWINGGFAFKIGNKWYSLLVYTRKQSASSTIRIALNEQTESATNASPWLDVCYLSTPILLTNGQTPENMDIKIAYYGDSFYIQLFDSYAFKICAELFSDKNVQPTGTKWPIFFSATENDNGNQTKRPTFYANSTKNFFGKGDRTLGFRAIDFENTFTNIEYSLNNQSALNAVKEMRKIAEMMDYEIPTETPWTEESDLPAYEWSTTAQEMATNGIDFDYGNGQTPKNLTTLFGSLADLKAKYTVNGVTVNVEDTANFIPTANGTLTLIPRNRDYAKTPLEVAVRVKNTQRYAVTFSVTYPEWYKETNYIDTITVNAKNKVSKQTETLTATKKSDNTYTVEMLNGNYDVSVLSTRFNKVDVSDFTVAGENKSLSTNAIQFTAPKLGNESGVTYNDTGFVVPNGNTKFRPLSNVEATEGFVVSYEMETTKVGSADVWYNGGFAFKIAERWYSLIVYTRKNETNTMRIGLQDQAETSANTCAFDDLCFLSSPITLTTENLSKLKVRIAFYNGSYYVQVADVYAFRICPALFDAQRPALDNWPVFIADSTVTNYNEKNNLTKSENYKTGSTTKFFSNSASRTLGFRAIDGKNTFTNVQYKLGNEKAIEVIKEMREVAKYMAYDIPSETPWTEESNLTVYEWNDQAIELASSGITFDYDRDESIDLTQYFDKTIAGAYMKAIFTANGVKTNVVDIANFIPTQSGTLTLLPYLTGYDNTALNINVVVNNSVKHKVTFSVAYPEWYKETNYLDTITVTAKNKVSSMVETLTLTNEGENNYSFELFNGNYEVSIMSTRFNKVVISDFTVAGENKALSASAIAFGAPKIVNDSKITYNETGFVVPRDNKTFRPLENVVATEGFVISYDMATAKVGSNDVWYNGGFAFKIGSRWYSLVVYTRKNITSATVRIGIQDQAQESTNVCKWEGSTLCFLSTPITLTSSELSNLKVKIAFYKGSYYVQVGENYAFKICPELFDEARPKSDEWPVFFADSTVANYNEDNNVSKRKTFASDSSSKFFNVNENRTLGFRAIDGNNTFTNVQYQLGNTAAIEEIKNMRKVAENMAYDIPDETPWPAFSDLPAYEWSSNALDYVSKGINFAYNLGQPLDLVKMFGSEANISATYTIDGVKVKITDLANFKPEISGILTIKAHVSGKAKNPLNVVVTVTGAEKYNVSFNVKYPDWYKETSYEDTITINATNKVSSITQTLTATKGTDGKYAIELMNGTYDISVSSTRFVTTNIKDVEVNNRDKEMSNVTFTTPKLNTDTVTYNDTGFVRGANTFTKLANVSATEGFVIRYTVDVTNSGTTWFAGGFGFEMGGKTYGIGVYTRKDQAGTIRIGLHDSSTWRTNNDNGPAFLTTSLSVTADELTHLDVEIAYYQGNYYVKVENKFAFRICPELFASQVTNNNYPIYFGDNTDNGNTNKRAFFSAAGHSTEGKSKIFDAGTRSLGFKTYQGTSKFTNVQYELGNEAAIKAIYGTAAENYQGGMYGVMKAMRNSSNAEFNYISGTEWPLKN